MVCAVAGRGRGGGDVTQTATRHNGGGLTVFQLFLLGTRVGDVVVVEGVVGGEQWRGVHLPVPQLLKQSRG